MIMILFTSATCVWEAIPRNECPANSKISKLDKCTHDMKHGEICEASTPFPKGMDKSAMQITNHEAIPKGTLRDKHNWKQSKKGSTTL